MQKFLTIADVAENLSVSAGQVRTLIKNGELSAIQVGGRGQWRISEQAVEEYIQTGYERTREKISSNNFDE
ncbi:helix-turn-helix domain-containing protein [Arcanobacterium phocisimile]|uniref:Helix-turn-helix domain-containing protein n=1 Tax=Arcanobacterium phocisimile TaxID=1302235 RepID=A0ABX7IKW2_9ACTO|nr:helix-turn-helix domain-containing protein [Arcanobacterium phocisimile]QRV02468.1 helix-turn-helix domain-containing protein [Arcanobacterium phocisimile]